MPLTHPVRVTGETAGNPTGNAPRRRPSSVEHLRIPVAVLVALVGLLVACEPENFGRVIAVENRTAVTLTVEAVDGGGERIRGWTVAAGQSRDILFGWASFDEYSLVGRDECTIVDLVALDPDGREVARHPPPLCLDDVWVIESE